MQLTAAVDADDRYLELDEPFEPPALLAYIQVDSEVMLVARGFGAARIRVRRGQGGTTAASHEVGAAVESIGGGGPHTHDYLEPD